MLFRLFSSQGVAGHDDNSAYQDLLDRHPSLPCPVVSLTCLTNHLLSGKALSCLAPWLCGVPLTSLLKGVHLIAVGEVNRHLARLCCIAVRSSFPGVFLPYGLVGVGIPGDLETPIHVTHYYINHHASDSSLAPLKIDMRNVFNEYTLYIVVLLFLNALLIIFWRFQLGSNGATLNQLSSALALDVSLPPLVYNKVISWALCFFLSFVTIH